MTIELLKTFIGLFSNPIESTETAQSSWAKWKTKKIEELGYQGWLVYERARMKVSRDREREKMGEEAYLKRGRESSAKHYWSHHEEMKKYNRDYQTERRKTHKIVDGKWIKRSDII